MGMLVRSSLSLILLVLSTADCRTWADVRDDARALKDEMAVCSAGDTCVAAKVPLNECTGELSCDFPVRADKKAEAENRAAELAQESMGFNECVKADGVCLYKAVCDAATSRCVFRP